tara:strand:- start:118 stop:714 length:597 start_codon:yes stop_codon:yes gene_type:complete
MAYWIPKSKANTFKGLMPGRKWETLRGSDNLGLYGQTILLHGGISYDQFCRNVRSLAHVLGPEVSDALLKHAQHVREPRPTGLPPTGKTYHPNKWNPPPKPSYQTDQPPSTSYSPTPPSYSHTFEEWCSRLLAPAPAPADVADSSDDENDDDNVPLSTLRRRLTSGYICGKKPRKPKLYTRMGAGIPGGRIALSKHIK